MARVGDILELLFAGPDPTVPVHAVIDEYFDAELAVRASDALMAEVKQGLKGKAPAGVRVAMVPAMAAGMAVAAGMSVSDRLRRRPRPEPRPTGASRLEVWLGPTGTARVERTYSAPGGPATAGAVVMIDDARAGSGLPAFPKLDDPSGYWPVPGDMHVERHFAHRLLRRVVAALELGDTHHGEVAGRPVIVAQAIRRDADGLWPHWLPFAPGGYTLSFDCEYADLLTLDARAEGEVLESAAVTAITYGSPMP